MKYNNPSLPYYLAIDAFVKFGPVRQKKLYAAFSTPELIWKATLQELIASGLEPKITEEFLAWRPTIQPDSLLSELIKEEISVALIFEDDYPELLKEIFDPPYLLYYKGVLQNITTCLAVVGSRKFSRYGQEVTTTLIRDLAKSGLVIVSGLALGIDALAHNAALDARGVTWAVLGTGLDNNSIYPSSNRYLAQKIISSGGCVISEFKPKTGAMPHHFPLRNRIIAGLSVGTLVIEAALKSGSLITAQLTLDYGREVMAVPGAINSPLSEGTNHLLKQGAHCITQANDILELLDLNTLTSYSNSNSYLPENDLELLILSFLSREGLHIDELVRICKLPVSTMHGQLLMLEMKGVIKNLGNMEYIKL